MKTRDKYKLQYTIKEFKTEKVEDKDMDLGKAERLLKELLTRDGTSNYDFHFMSLLSCVIFILYLYYVVC